MLKADATDYVGCNSNYDATTNGTAAGAVTIPLNAEIKGLINPAGDIDNFRIVITTACSLRITLNSLPADYDLKLFNSAGLLLAISQAGGTPPEVITYSLPVGTYYAQVYGYGGAFNAVSCYTLTAQIYAWTGSSGAVINEDAAAKASNAYPAETLISKTSVKIFPNPAGNVLNIAIAGKSIKNAILSIVDAKGITVKEERMSNSAQQVNLAGLAGGVYVLRLNDEGFITTIKFVKR